MRFVFVDRVGNEDVEEDTLPGYRGATNNEMELMGCIKALQHASAHGRIRTVGRVVVFTDSLYVKDNVARAMFQWSKQKWLNRQGRPIENATLWKDLLRIIKKVPKRVDFEWVKGHSKDVHNKAVDKLAKRSAKGVLNDPLNVTTVRRKNSRLAVEIGSVPMRGQTLSIRIITDTYLRVQRTYKYKYEVLADSPELAGRVDLIFADQCLRAGHHYEVRVNDEPGNPRKVEVVRELERSAPAASQSP